MFPDASWAAVALLQGIKIQDLRTASRLFGLGILTTSVAITKTGNQLMYGDLAGLVTIIDLETHEQVLLSDFAQPVWSVDWSPDARFILVGYTSGAEIRNLGVDPPAPVFVINVHGNSQINDARFSSDGNLAVTLGKDSIIRVWGTAKPRVRDTRLCVGQPGRDLAAHAAGLESDPGRERGHPVLARRPTQARRLEPIARQVALTSAPAQLSRMPSLAIRPVTPTL